VLRPRTEIRVISYLESQAQAILEPPVSPAAEVRHIHGPASEKQSVTCGYKRVEFLPGREMVTSAAMPMPRQKT
jgi:hypothetical protein